MSARERGDRRIRIQRFPWFLLVSFVVQSSLVCQVFNFRKDGPSRPSCLEGRSSQLLLFSLSGFFYRPLQLTSQSRAKRDPGQILEPSCCGWPDSTGTPTGMFDRLRRLREAELTVGRAVMAWNICRDGHSTKCEKRLGRVEEDPLVQAGKRFARARFGSELCACGYTKYDGDD